MSKSALRAYTFNRCLVFKGFNNFEYKVAEIKVYLRQDQSKIHAVIALSA